MPVRDYQAQPMKARPTRLTVLFNLSIIALLIVATLGLRWMLPEGQASLAIYVSVLTFCTVYLVLGPFGQSIITKITNKFDMRSWLMAQDSRFGQRSLSSANHDYFDALESLPIALISITPNGEIAASNKLAQNLLCIDKDEDVSFSDVAEGLGRSVTLWLDTERQSPQMSKPQMLKVKRAKNDIFLQVSLAQSHNNSDGNTVAVLTDATELKTLEAQFVQSQKMQAIGQLAGGVAHDFNNLLTAISGYCDLLKLRHEKGDADYGDLVQIGHNANRAAALVGQLLAFSRKQTLQPKMVQVNDTLTDLTHLLNRLVGEKINLVLECAKSLPNAYVDSRQLEQVILNLVVNARDAMLEGGTIKIITKAKTFSENKQWDKVEILAGRYVCIEVEDEGEGINSENLSKIFEPFFSTKKVGEGTGLGLSTAYGIVKQTGGYIFAQSTEGVGTKFTLFLPVVQRKPRDQDVEDNDKSKLKTSMAGAHVLLVEDEDSVRAFASRALTMQGVILYEARSGDDALVLAKEHKADIDVIISDVIMPGMNGPEWVQKAREFCPDAKVIYMSGYAEEIFDDENDAVAEYEFLPKPFPLQSLIQTVSSVLD